MSTSSQPSLLFVYGTLKEPRRLEALIGTVSQWRACGHGTVQGRLYDVGPYPALVASADTNDQVPGVLIELASGSAALARLDAYEGVADGWYERRRISMRLTDGTRQDAWAYIYRGSVDGLPRIVEWTR
jgi:gamma-glutamylcyclotransferase (GGCT)/AIG2-like uncharacterized protein YtfP